MGRKKKTEEAVVVDESVIEVTEPITTTEEVVAEEKPKAKRGRKAKAVPTEESVVEETAVEEPAVEVVNVDQEVAEIYEEIKAESAETPEPEVTVVEPELIKIEEDMPATSESEAFTAKVYVNVLHSRRGPGYNYRMARTVYKGTVLHISEVDGNWGKISPETWVNINFVEKI